jgi:hypothetical protein
MRADAQMKRYSGAIVVVKRTSGDCARRQVQTSARGPRCRKADGRVARPGSVRFMSRVVAWVVREWAQCAPVSQ